jgi:hypothetical protein
VAECAGAIFDDTDGTIQVAPTSVNGFPVATYPHQFEEYARSTGVWKAEVAGIIIRESIMSIDIETAYSAIPHPSFFFRPINFFHLANDLCYVR